MTERWSEEKEEEEEEEGLPSDPENEDTQYCTLHILFPSSTWIHPL